MKNDIYLLALSGYVHARMLIQVISNMELKASFKVVRSTNLSKTETMKVVGKFGLNLFQVYFGEDRSPYFNRNAHYDKIWIGPT